MIVPLLYRMKYSAKLMLSGYLYGAFVYLIVLLTVLANAERWSIGVADISTVTSVLLIGLPVFNILLFSNLFAEDLEERTLRLLFTYRLKSTELLIERVMLASFVSLAAYAICLSTAHWMLVRFSADGLWDVSRQVLPATIYLSIIALLFTLVGRGALLGLGAGIAYWMLELTTMGKWTGPLFIFQQVFPTQNVKLGDNALYVTLVAAVCFALCVLMFTIGKRRLSV